MAKYTAVRTTKRKKRKIKSKSVKMKGRKR